MKCESAVRVLAGSLVLLGMVMGFTLNVWWFALTAFVGVNLIQSAFTGFCPAEMIFKMFGCKSAGAAPPATD